jgi:hypothetical protein
MPGREDHMGRLGHNLSREVKRISLLQGKEEEKAGEGISHRLHMILQHAVQ